MARREPNSPLQWAYLNPNTCGAFAFTATPPLAPPHAVTGDQNPGKIRASGLGLARSHSVIAECIAANLKQSLHTKGQEYGQEYGYSSASR
eukprot:CAMPEP_0172211090 /NCGR_PEP_ID=MMETSP1050-20130122/36202_1 /TAXON_ID=233186 /ORGANISM="Cryptomonas curvata, Strain CCAP979/52" /LENGTH=90 /DNA_ID=CAMNT_0012891489 /DNA_START=705 /DNA_END=977 /DNA_ORIENTATION=+